MSCVNNSGCVLNATSIGIFWKNVTTYLGILVSARTKCKNEVNSWITTSIPVRVSGKQHFLGTASGRLSENNWISWACNFINRSTDLFQVSGVWLFVQFFCTFCISHALTFFYHVWNYFHHFLLCIFSILFFLKCLHILCIWFLGLFLYLWLTALMY